MKHIYMPTPWAVDPNDEFAVIDASEVQIGFLHNEPAELEGFIEEQKANTCLVAAAPDMYAALEEIIREKELHGQVVDGTMTARKALAKARGE